MGTWYCYYLEAIALRDKQGMPRVRPCVDRHTFGHVKANMSEDAVKGLVCSMSCARVSTSCSGKTNNALIRASSYLCMLTAESFRLNWCFHEYVQHYVYWQVQTHRMLIPSSWTLAVHGGDAWIFRAYGDR